MTRNKMIKYEAFKPIRNLGLLLISVGAAGLICHLAFMVDHDYIIIAQVFVVSVSVFHLFIGFNIVSRNRLGFKSLRIYLYLIYPGFPLGYFYAKRMFEYIEKNKIESFFRRSLKL